jgi:hypothetical protein
MNGRTQPPCQIGPESKQSPQYPLFKPLYLSLDVIAFKGAPTTVLARLVPSSCQLPGFCHCSSNGAAMLKFCIASSRG